MADKIFDLARATCSAKYMIRASWSLVGGLSTELLPTQAETFQIADTGGSDVLCTAGPPPWPDKENVLLANRSSSKQIPQDAGINGSL